MRLTNNLARRPLLLSALTTSLLTQPLALRAATPPPYTLSVPDSFVTLAPRDSSTLYVAGNFATGTTLSVQRLTASSVLASASPCGDGASALSCTAGVAALAVQLAAVRDRQAAPSGSSSKVMPESIRADGGKLSFEMLLTLVGDNASDAMRADPELSRRTAVAVLVDGDDELLCLWAGAKVINWDRGDGELLRRAVASFALAPK